MIQRYEPYTNGTMIDYGCKESEDGDYVKYEDHVKCVTDLEQKLKNKEHAIGLLKEMYEKKLNKARECDEDETCQYCANFKDCATEEKASCKDFSQG